MAFDAGLLHEMPWMASWPLVRDKKAQKKAFGDGVLDHINKCRQDCGEGLSDYGSLSPEELLGRVRKISPAPTDI
eukprot:10439850-Lingulodinium_polyedra.AAC.1